MEEPRIHIKWEPEPSWHINAFLGRGSHLSFNTFAVFQGYVAHELRKFSAVGIVIQGLFRAGKPYAFLVMKFSKKRRLTANLTLALETPLATQIPASVISRLPTFVCDVRNGNLFVLANYSASAKISRSLSGCIRT